MQLDQPLASRADKNSPNFLFMVAESELGLHIFFSGDPVGHRIVPCAPQETWTAISFSSQSFVSCICHYGLVSSARETLFSHVHQSVHIYALGRGCLAETG